MECNKEWCRNDVTHMVKAMNIEFMDGLEIDEAFFTCEEHLEEAKHNAGLESEEVEIVEYVEGMEEDLGKDEDGVLFVESVVPPNYEGRGSLN